MINIYLCQQKNRSNIKLCSIRTRNLGNDKIPDNTLFIILCLLYIFYIYRYVSQMKNCLSENRPLAVTIIQHSSVTPLFINLLYENMFVQVHFTIQKLHVKLSGMYKKRTRHGGGSPLILLGVKRS